MVWGSGSWTSLNFSKSFFSVRLELVKSIYAKFNVCRLRGFGETEMSQWYVSFTSIGYIYIRDKQSYISIRMI